MDGSPKVIDLDCLVPFQKHEGQLYRGERLEQLAESIERQGLLNHVIVREIADGKYEILSGHNRVAAVRMLGRKSILADVKTGLSDDDAVQIYYDTNLNQHSFSDMSYSKRLDAIIYAEEIIRRNSQQGKRTDLLKKEDVASDEETSVQSRQKSDKNETSRDRMARRMGISTATLSKYRSIIKLDSETVRSIGELLDQRRISLEAAYRISKLKPSEANLVVRHLKQSSGKKYDLEAYKHLCEKSKGTDSALTDEEIIGTLTDHRTLKPIRVQYSK